jgi:hypothetical protein
VGEDGDNSSKLQLSHLYAYTYFPPILRVALGFRNVLSSSEGVSYSPVMQALKCTVYSFDVVA